MFKLTDLKEVTPQQKEVKAGVEDEIPPEALPMLKSYDVYLKNIASIDSISAKSIKMFNILKALKVTTQGLRPKFLKKVYTFQ